MHGEMRGVNRVFWEYGLETDPAPCLAVPDVTLQFHPGTVARGNPGDNGVA